MDEFHSSLEWQALQDRKEAAAVTTELQKYRLWLDMVKQHNEAVARAEAQKREMDQRNPVLIDFDRSG